MMQTMKAAIAEPTWGWVEQADDEGAATPGYPRATAQEHHPVRTMRARWAVPNVGAWRRSAAPSQNLLKERRMSSQSSFTAPGGTGAGARATDDYAVERSGWVTFAGVMLSIVGVVNIIYGIAAIDNANFYINDAKYVISDLNAWGWIIAIIGAIQVGAAFSIFGGTSWGRWAGVAVAGVNAIAQLLFLPSYPFLSLALFAIDILVIHALITHGGRRERAV
jgi:hypothetical protein